MFLNAFCMFLQPLWPSTKSGEAKNVCELAMHISWTQVQVKQWKAMMAQYSIIKLQVKWMPNLGTSHGVKMLSSQVFQIQIRGSVSKSSVFLWNSLLLWNSLGSLPITPIYDAWDWPLPLLKFLQVWEATMSLSLMSWSSPKKPIMGFSSAKDAVTSSHWLCFINAQMQWVVLGRHTNTVLNLTTGAPRRKQLGGKGGEKI